MEPRLHDDELACLVALQQGLDPMQLQLQLPGGRSRVAYCLVQLASFGLYDRDRGQLTARGLAYAAQPVPPGLVLHSERVTQIGILPTTTTPAADLPTDWRPAGPPPQAIGDDRLD